MTAPFEVLDAATPLLACNCMIAPSFGDNKFRGLSNDSDHALAQLRDRSFANSTEIGHLVKPTHGFRLTDQMSAERAVIRAAMATITVGSRRII